MQRKLQIKKKMHSAQRKKNQYCRLKEQTPYHRIED